ncbi:Zinc finger CCCH domain-containing protein 3, partial [Galemys pyrenaicus]
RPRPRWNPSPAHAGAPPSAVVAGPTTRPPRDARAVSGRPASGPAPSAGNGRAAMTLRGPGRASRTLEMEEKEQLRRQIRLLQGGSAAPASRVPFPRSPPAVARPPPRGGPLRRGLPASGRPDWRPGVALCSPPPGGLGAAAVAAAPSPGNGGRLGQVGAARRRPCPLSTAFAGPARLLRLPPVDARRRLLGRRVLPSHSRRRSSGAAPVDTRGLGHARASVSGSARPLHLGAGPNGRVLPGDRLVGLLEGLCCPGGPSRGDSVLGLLWRALLGGVGLLVSGDGPAWCCGRVVEEVTLLSKAWALSTDLTPGVTTRGAWQDEQQSRDWWGLQGPSDLTPGELSGSVISGLIDDYKNLHGNAPCPSAASRWQPPAYSSSRAVCTRYPRPGRRAFPLNHAAEWRKKYSLVNRPPGPLDPPSEGAAQPSLQAGASQDPDPQQYVLERQVQLSSDQNMVIKIKPTSKPGSASASGAPRGYLEGDQDTPRSDPRPQEGEGEPPGGQRQPSRLARVKGCCSAEEPLLVCQKEPGKPRAAKPVSSVGDSSPEPRRTVSESAIVVRACCLPSTPPLRSGASLGRKGGPHAGPSCATQLLGDARANTSHPERLAASSLGVALARPASGPRQTREALHLGPCRTSKFQKSNYKWVASSAKSPRATRRALSPRAAADNGCKAPVGPAESAEKPQLRADPGASARRATAPPTPGASPSKYKWKASSPSASSSSSFHWPSEGGSKDRASQLSPVPSRSPPGGRPATVPGSSKPLVGETSPSAYKVKSRTKIIRRRTGASLPGDKRSSPPPAATARSQLSLRRRQALQGRSSTVLKRTPPRALASAARPRLCGQLPAKEASGPLHAPRTPPASRVIKTRYRIVKKTAPSALPTPSVTLSVPSWRARRLPLSRSLVLNRPRPAAGPSRAQPSAPGWRGRGYRCIGGVLYRVSANKLSKTSGRPGDGGSRPLLRAGRADAASGCSRSLASRALQRSLAIVRQARQRRRRRAQEFCMYYNRFGRCHRGARCPYVHDPEKVAVCTRFVRGTCKKTDGTCPFSHHVAKEKMPVCSYFLRGVCSSSDCPYSHVYVSRKAEVCADFLRGYCPLGAKCKKKHTLLCPDFSRRGACPRGAQCRLLHRSQTRPRRRAAPEPSAPPRSRAPSSHGTRKSSAAPRPPRQSSAAAAPSSSRAALPSSLPSPSSPDSSPSSPSASQSLSLDQEALSAQEEAASAVTSSSRLAKLPSFISLQSTPSPGGQPRARTPRGPPAKDAGRAGPRAFPRGRPAGPGGRAGWPQPHRPRGEG